MGYTVYMHITPNSKKYIGITCRRVKDRWKNGKGYEKQLFYNAIKRYGWENIEHKILFENLTLEEAEKKEIELIKQYKTRNRKFGYNIDGGGSVNRDVSAETRLKISQKKKGQVHSRESIEKQRQKLIGRKATPEHKEKLREYWRTHKKVFTPEQRKKISERVSGKNHPLFGKHHTEETKQKMSRSRKGINKGAMKQSTKDKLSQCHQKDKQTVLQYDKNMNFIQKYESISSVHKICGFDSCAIHRCMVGKQHTSYGYIWKRGE